MDQCRDLGILPNHAWSRAFAIIDGGLVLGYSSKAAPPYDERAVIWRGGAIVDLNSLLVAGSCAFVDSATAIDGQGRIVAIGFSNGRVSMVLAPVPGPQADVTGDCKVNVNDLLRVINEWGKTTSPADINQDAIVNVLDLYLVIENWTY
jgi:hypothetical protein